MSSLKPATREKLKSCQTRRGQLRPSTNAACEISGFRMCTASTPKPVRWLDRRLRFGTCRHARI